MPALGKFAYLLVAFLVLFLIFPFARSGIAGIGLLDILSTTIFAAAIYAVSRRRKILAAALVLAVPALVTNWSTYFVKSTNLAATGHAFYAAFFTLTAIVILAAVLRAGHITLDVLLGALCAYFVLGMVFAYVFACLELSHPGSFTTASGQSIDAGGPGVSDESSLIYFSFCTLTTLGYGDIVAVTKPARSLATLEALVGQFYLAVLVARMVGLHIVYSTLKKPDETN